MSILKPYNEAGYRCLIIPREEWQAAKKVLESMKLYDKPIGGIMGEGKFAEIRISDEAFSVTTIENGEKKIVNCTWDGGIEGKISG